MYKNNRVLKKIKFYLKKLVYYVPRIIRKHCRGKTWFVIFTRENWQLCIMIINRKKHCVFVNARETDCTSSCATIVLEILSHGKVKGNCGLVICKNHIARRSRQNCRIISTINESAFRFVNTRRHCPKKEKSKEESFLADTSESILIHKWKNLLIIYFIFMLNISYLYWILSKLFRDVISFLCVCEA